MLLTSQNQIIITIIKIQSAHCQCLHPIRMEQPVGATTHAARIAHEPIPQRRRTADVWIGATSHSRRVGVAVVNAEARVGAAAGSVVDAKRKEAPLKHLDGHRPDQSLMQRGRSRRRPRGWRGRWLAATSGEERARSHREQAPHSGMATEGVVGVRRCRGPRSLMVWLCRRRTSRAAQRAG